MGATKAWSSLTHYPLVSAEQADMTHVTTREAAKPGEDLRDADSFEVFSKSGQFPKVAKSPTPYTPQPEPYTLTLHLEPTTLNPEPQTLNPEPQTINVETP